MWTFLLILLVAWIVLSIIGFVIEGLLWLAFIGLVLFVGTLIFGAIRRRAGLAKLKEAGLANIRHGLLGGGMP